MTSGSGMNRTDRNNVKLKEQQNEQILFVSKQGAAKMLDVSTRTIEREVSSGRLKKYMVRGCVRFLVTDVQRLGGIENPNSSRHDP